MRVGSVHHAVRGLTEPSELSLLCAIATSQMEGCTNAATLVFFGLIPVASAYCRSN